MNAVRIACFAAALLLLAGCSAYHVAGVDDVVTEYAIAPSKIPDATVVWRVQERLAILGLGASVSTPSGGRLRIAVDAREARGTATFARWDGGIRIYRIDETLGASAAPSRPPPGRAVVAERVGATGWSYRQVYAAPLLASADLPFARVDEADGGRAIAVALDPPAEDALRRVAFDLPDGAELALVGPDGIAFGVLRARAATELPLVVPFGDDLYAFPRAREARALLAAGNTPALTLVTQRTVPFDARLAAGCLAFPALISLAWLLALRRLDRAQPEPMWLLLFTFAFGALAQIAAYVELPIQRFSQYTNLRAMAKDHELGAFPGDFAMTLAVVGLIEEGLKLAAVWVFARRRRQFDEPVDGMIYAGAAALGFAALENLQYFANYRVTAGVVSVRGLESVPMHVLMSAVWGYAMGKKLVDRRVWVLPYFLVAACGHAAFDTLLTMGMRRPAQAVFAAFSVAFVVLLRKALRHGAVQPGVPVSDERQLFRVGSRVAFALCVAVMLACGWMLVDIAGKVPRGAAPADAWSLLARGYAYVTALAAAFWGASATMPLDVVLDARGLTYAGALFPWHLLGPPTADGRALLVPVTNAGTLRIAPVAADTMERLAAAVGARTAP